MFWLLQYLNYMVSQLWSVDNMVVVTLRRLSCQCSSSEDIQLRLNSYSNLPIFSHVIHFHDEVSLYLTPKTSHSIWTLTLLSVFIILPLTLKSPLCLQLPRTWRGKKKGTAWLKVKGARHHVFTCTEGKNHTGALYWGELLKCLIIHYI